MKKLLFILMLLPVFAIAQETEDSTITTNIAATYDDVITKKVKGSITSYTTQSGETFSVGDTITIGAPFTPNEYSFLNQNAVVQAYPMRPDAAGSKIRIKTMKAIMKKVQVMCTHASGYTYQTFIINFELAYQNGEIKPNKMTSDEALIELKKCKDKLDLGLITQEEFDKKKAELAKIIK